MAYPGRDNIIVMTHCLLMLLCTLLTLQNLTKRTEPHGRVVELPTRDGERAHGILQ